jgi:hypothetical protein
LTSTNEHLHTITMAGDAVIEHFAIPLPRDTTQAAEGLPRWRWTVAEVERMAVHD